MLGAVNTVADQLSGPGGAALEHGVVRVDFNVVRVKGQGLIRKSTKTESGERTLALPSWCVGMLHNRVAEAPFSEEPVFPDSLGGLRDPSNARRVLRGPGAAKDSPGSRAMSSGRPRPRSWMKPA